MRETARNALVAAIVFVSVVALALALWKLRLMLALLFLAFIVAAALRPGVEALKRRRIPRGGGILLHYAGLAALVGLLLWLVVPRAVDQIATATDSSRLESQARQSTDTFLASVYVPIADAAIEIARRRPERALERLRPSEPYELGFVAVLAPVYLRAQAYLDLGRGADAAREFRTVLAHRGSDPFSPMYVLAHLGLARALRMTGEAEESRKAYAAFLEEWKNADESIPVLQAARQEYRASGGS